MDVPTVSTVSRDPPIHRDPPVATLADGSRLRGVAIGDVDAYRGVPFALRGVPGGGGGGARTWLTGTPRT